MENIKTVLDGRFEVLETDDGARVIFGQNHGYYNAICNMERQIREQMDIYMQSVKEANEGIQEYRGKGEQEPDYFQREIQTNFSIYTGLDHALRILKNNLSNAHRFPND